MYCVWTRNGGVRFLLKPAGYLRDRRGLFLNGAGFRLDIGRVSQLLEYTLSNSVTPMCANSFPHSIITHKNISELPIAVNLAEWRKL
jgi:hypothetical protein